MTSEKSGTVVAVSTDSEHRFSKHVRDRITLLEGLGVEGDAHMSKTVQHRSRRAQDPTLPNLRQVHLIHSELLDELNAGGFQVAPGDLGENVMTRGINLLSLPLGTRLRLGADAVVELTGLRNPCRQLDDFQPRLMAAVLDRDDQGKLIRKSGVMSVVVAGGELRAGDRIAVELPTEPHSALQPV